MTIYKTSGSESVINHDRERLRSTWQSLKAFNVLSVVFGFMMVGLMVTLSWQAWRQEVSTATLELLTVTEVGARALDVYFDQLETGLKTLAEAIAEKEPTPFKNEFIGSAALEQVRRFSGLHPELTNVSVVRADGKILLSAKDSQTPGRDSISEEDSFKAFPKVTLYGIDVGRPMVDYATTRWTIPVRYSVANEQQSLIYFISASLPVEFFSRFWKNAPIVRKGSLGLLRDDGFLLSRFPTNRPVDYSVVSQGTVSDFLQNNAFPKAGSVFGFNRTEGADCLNVFTRLSSHDLTLFIALPTTEIWAAWWTKVQTSFFLCALVLTGGIFVVRLMATRQEKFEASLNAALQSAEQLGGELDVALTHMSHGLCLFDASQRLVVRNDRYLKLYGLNPEAVKPGITLNELAAQQATGGTIANFNEEKLKVFLAAMKQEKTLFQTRGLVDGRTIAITNCPLASGGWVATHEDITERADAERNLQHAQRFLNAVIENMPAILSAKHIKTRTYALANKGACALFGYKKDQIIGKTPHELFSKDQADYFSTRDDEAIARGGTLLVDEHAVFSAGNGVRVLNTTKLTIPDDAGAPEYLISFSEDITERRQAEANIAHMAHHDPLTNLANRTLLRLRLEAALLGSQPGRFVAVLFLDLDHFKSINDTFGHGTGDELLKMVAARLSTCTGEFDTVARLGGDEFVVLLTNLEKREDAEGCAAAIQDALMHPIEVGAQQIFAKVSIGISLAPNDVSSADQLLQNADMALYAAKSAGRGTFCFFEPAMHADLKERQAIELDLREALARSEFELYYQPIVGLGEDVVVGCEALIRWHHPVRGMVPPLDFIRIAEDTGLITQLGEWVLKTACLEAARWPSHLTVAVNVSPVQFKSSGLFATIVAALNESGLEASRLEIEITETVLMQKSEIVIETLRALHALGVRIALDDFGTGYSSLAYLKEFPFDKIKIDKSFIDGLSENPDAGAIIRAVTSLAGELHMTTTAEGIETLDQLAKIRECGCTSMQGYFFSRPVPAPALQAFFERKDVSSSLSLAS